MSEIKNASISDTFLGIEDHGIFTFVLTLDYGWGVQGAGMYSLRGKETVPLIKRILEICGARQWEEVRGKMIRADADHCKVNRVGHMIKEDWLDFKSFFDGYAENEE